ncbi:MAG: hypothetical protein EHM42_01450, partial [Planctomycetaceae bacterium]
MRETTRELYQTLLAATGLSRCTREHPWVTAGSVVAAGFVTGAIVSWRGRSSTHRGDPNTNASPAVNSAPSESRRPDSVLATNGLLMTTLGTLLPGIAQSLLQGLVTAPVSAANADPVRIKVQTPSGATNCDRDNSLT